MARRRVEKCPARAVTNSTTGSGSDASLRKWRREEKGVETTVSSHTGVGSPATMTWSMPKGGRSWVRRARSIIS